jgi:hypothetical protein
MTVEGGAPVRGTAWPSAGLPSRVRPETADPGSLVVAGAFAPVDPRGTACAGPLDAVDPSLWLPPPLE